MLEVKSYFHTQLAFLSYNTVDCLLGTNLLEEDLGKSPFVWIYSVCPSWSHNFQLFLILVS